jgi:hypothetical protein
VAAGVPAVFFVRAGVMGGIHLWLATLLAAVGTVPLQTGTYSLYARLA